MEGVQAAIEKEWQSREETEDKVAYNGDKEENEGSTKEGEEENAIA